MASSAGPAPWKAIAPGRFSPPRAALALFFRARFLLLLGTSCLIILLWRSLHTSSSPRASGWTSGPRTSPQDMTANEAAAWAARHATPVVFGHNPHAPIAVGSATVARVDLNGVNSTRRAAAARERVLVLTPLRDASAHLGRYFDLLDALTYPHELIDLGFLVSNSADDTLAVLAANLNRVQEGRDGRAPFRSVVVVEKDFEVVGSQEVNDRHGWKMQGPRRKTMGRARNYLLATALRPDHSWVYWRDVDIADSPPQILEDFMLHDKDVIVPNIWFHRFKPNDKGKMVDVEGRCGWSPPA
jgi:Anp1